jgi:hypothetical protein
MFNLGRNLFLSLILVALIATLAIPSGLARHNEYWSQLRINNERREEFMVNSLLDKLSTMQFGDYNPSYLIEAVNALQPLGKEKALEYIDSYIESLDQGECPYGLFWLLRVMFDVAEEQGFPQVRLGKPTIPPPADSGKLPRFPIVIVQDIPFLVIKGYFLGGLPEQIETHVAYFRVHGILRQQPLIPPVSMDGIENALLQQWKDAYGNDYTTEVLETIKPQIARMSSSRDVM